MVINPDELIKELDEISSKGIETSNMKISSKAVILMPYHIDLDSISEGGKTSIGTTKRGIGYAYADKARRNALRFEDLLDLAYCKERIERVLPTINAELAAKGAGAYTVKEVYEKCVYWAEKLGAMITEPVSYINNALNAGKHILFEGQLGGMKDIDLGIYPYVTSSNPVAAYASVSAGFSIKHITNIIGVMKAFSSAVGAGPFPTEMDCEQSKCFRGDGSKVDDEFGARTGRARRLGWLDLPVLKYTSAINGFTELAVCKIDKLDIYEKIKLNGKIIDYMPPVRELDKVEPVYITVDGWLSDTSKIREYDKLPENAKKYLEIIEQYTGAKVKYIGVGPMREEIIVR
jgi:adenylosuccinate synthase